MIAEFIVRGGISQASLKSVFADAGTRSPTQGGDFDVKEQKF